MRSIRGSPVPCAAAERGSGESWLSSHGRRIRSCAARSMVAQDRLLPVIERSHLPGKARRYGIRLFAGLVDAAIASAGTFLIGLFAVRTLPADQLGVFALAFTAFLVGGVVPRSFSYTPIEAATIESSGTEPIGWFPRSVVAGIPLSVIGGLVAVVLSVLAITRPIPAPALVAIAAATWLSPMQDHGRQLLHLSQKSRWAAVTSVQFTTVVVASLLFVKPSDKDTLVFLFATLAIANAASIVTPAVIAIRNREVLSISLWVIAVRRGPWLLVAALLPVLAMFGTRSLVANVASFADAGYAEAARVVVAPVVVFSAGVLAVLKADLFRQGLGRTSRRWDLVALALSGTVAVAWGAVLLIGPSRSFMGELTPNAYVVPGLLVLTLAAALLVSAGAILEAVALGAGQEPAILGAQTFGTITKVAVAASVAATAGAIAQPVSTIAGNVTRTGFLGYFLHQRRADRSKP